MARILCIDYGGKRTGLAVTDPLQIIATGLTSVDTKDLHAFIKNYLLLLSHLIWAKVITLNNFYRISTKLCIEVVLTFCDIFQLE